MLVEQHGDAVGLLAGRAGRRPDGELPQHLSLRHELLDQRPQRLKRALVAEERRLVGHHRIEHITLERRVEAPLHAIDERVEAGDRPLLDDRHQPGDHEILLRVVDHHAGLAAQQRPQKAKLLRADFHGRPFRAGLIRPAA